MVALTRRMVRGRKIWYGRGVEWSGVDGEEVSERAWCNLCEPPRLVENEVLMRHLRLVHGFTEEPATWPDGELVIIDETLEPSDFEDEP